MKNESVIKRLGLLQKKIKAPKGQFNKFGNYKYRSCEDILTAAKLAMSEDEAVTIDDEIVLVGDRFYVKATATFNCPEGVTSTSAFAREQETKKGMDESQITGSASSYARKYALNGLLAIDDTKDADTMDNKTNGKDYKKLCFNLVRKITNNGTDKEAVDEIKNTFNVQGTLGEFIDNNKSLESVYNKLKELDI
jgi:hypothetical protein